MNVRTELGMRDVAVAAGCVVLLGAVIAAGGLVGREHAKGVACMTNVGGLARAWLLYAEDNDGLLVGESTYGSGSRRTLYRWCERPLVPGAPMPIPFGVNPAVYEASAASGTLNQEARLWGIRAGWLFAYTGNEGLYHCPGDMNVTRAEPYGVYRSYAISGVMNGEEAEYPRWIIWPGGEVGIGAHPGNG